MLDYSKSFIETQFPVSKISKESYKERKANLGQTLTGLGKWWGRKPLILVRAALLGVLLPVSCNPVRDRDIFLKILSMDNEGLLLRKFKSISLKDVYKILTPDERQVYFDNGSTEAKPKYISGISRAEKETVQKIVFMRLSYDDKLKYCLRPENVQIDETEVWKEINEHLETTASSLEELIEQLGIRRFGRRPHIGDCFAGGGSIPFEAARMGADVFASDLNPVAALLTWASLNISGASDSEIEKLKKYQKKVYDSVDNQIIEWGIEHNELSDRADSYLYCNETICPECGYKVPMAPSWIIGKGTKTVAVLNDNNSGGFDIEIIMNASKEQHEKSNSQITVRKGKLLCPKCEMETPIASIREDLKLGNGKIKYGLRLWEKNEFMPRNDDTFQERLYAIRYVGENGRYYCSPTEYDLQRESKVIELLDDRFSEWQLKGFIPSMRIEQGEKTDEPIRTRGWQYWHHMFTPRQLLVHGLFIEKIYEMAESRKELVVSILGLNKFINWNSKLSRWNPGAGVEKVVDTFSNQALNTIYNYGTRPFSDLNNLWYFKINNTLIDTNGYVHLKDARGEIGLQCDCWITDPPYADAVNYHELTEFFLAWDKTLLERAFPEWYTGSKRILAVKGTGQSFNDSMIEIYKNLASNMVDDGYQVVMFTHQDVKVWSELAMILWSAGLHVVSAWNIATETDASGLKVGNYVKGTVILVLKKKTSTEMAFQDEIYDEIKYEVKSIIDSMKDVDDKDDPDFTDADYQLAAYASSLKVLTAYNEIEGIDVDYWLKQPRNSSIENPVEVLINKAVKIAFDYLIPEGFENSHWKDLKREERFFIRGLEIEINGVYKVSSYQELARGFSVKDYSDMFASFKANSARLKTPGEYKMAYIGGDGFGSTLLRNILVAINETSKSKSTVEGRAYLKDKYKTDNQYWFKKPLMVELLSFIANIEFVDHMKHWHEYAYSAKLLREALKNEGV